VIVPMQKVTLLCSERERERVLAHLQDLALVHVQPVQPPSGASVEQAQALYERVRQALALLPKTGAGAPTRRPVQELVAALLADQAREKELLQQVAQDRAERARIEPLGRFDPESADPLRAHGLVLKLYEAPAGAEPALPAGALLHELRREHGQRTLLFVGRAGQSLDLREIPWPAHSPAALAQRIAAAERELAAIEQRRAELAGEQPRLLRACLEADDALQLQLAAAGLGRGAPLVWLQGFCPSPDLERLRAAARAHGCYVHAEEPSAADSVPTKIDNPPWIKPIQAVLDMAGILPGYGEPDVSPLFLVFLVLFASMLIGDAGYGVLFLVVTLLARQRFPAAPSYPFALLRAVSLGTIAWGTITGTWFGLASLPGPLEALRVDWLTLGDKLTLNRRVMFLCFLIGAVHLTLAHLWAAWRSRGSLSWIAQAGWIGSTWTMFFVARTMVLNEPFPGWLVPIAAGAVLFIILFMTPLKALKSEWFNHVMLPLTLVSNFVDVVSYLRLFAVGSAGVAVAGAFNGMAANLADGGLAGMLFAALVLLFGHVLNVLLCIMGVLVHGVRLNTLEFSAHIGIQWAGVPYRPLMRRAPAADPGARD
jgi:V/A-type H+-transporting ATPase subunit I